MVHIECYLSVYRINVCHETTAVAFVFSESVPSTGAQHLSKNTEFQGPQLQGPDHPVCTPVH
jgi:hypothetical protein